MSWLKDAMEFIAGKATAAEAVQIVELPGRGTAFLLRTGDKVQEHKSEPPPRAHTLFSLAAIEDAVNQWGEVDNTVVYLNATEITLVFDDHQDRLDEAVFKLPVHPQWVRLQQLVKQSSLPQKQVVRLLRHDLEGCVTDPALLTRLRSLEFKRSNDGGRTQEHGRESLGKSVELKVQNAAEIPEFTTLNVPLFDLSISTRQPIRCTIELDPLNEQIAIEPIPGQLELAMQAVLQSLQEHLKASTMCTVIIGRP